MIITFNCALDVYVRKGDISNSLDLFNEIDDFFTADLISYSTIIKGLCNGNRKKLALDYVKKMIVNCEKIDISVVNLFLDFCSNNVDYRLGIEGYKYTIVKNIKPNEITFGIMVKIYGFSRELHKAFDLLDLMAAYKIIPSIIVYTNLVHISFYNRKPKKAELAYILYKKLGHKGDRLLFSKIIDGLIRYREYSKVMKYVNYALVDGCSLKD